MPWTRFMDMHSGGGRKLSHEHILIEAPQAEAELVFYNRFRRNPYRVTCTCCGEDYSVSESATLEEATAYDRGCASVYVLPDGTELSENQWRDLSLADRRDMRAQWRYVERGDPDRSWRAYRTLDEYLAGGEALVIRADETKPEERTGRLPRQGYVWADGDE